MATTNGGRGPRGVLDRLRREQTTRVAALPPGPLTARDDTPIVDRPPVRKAFDLIALALFFYFIQQFFWPAPLGVLVQGTIIGGLTALIAFGIALIYRANRIINFSQGDLGGAPATLAVLMIVGPGLPYFLALPIGILAAVVLGGAVEFLIIRRFFKAPRLILTVATIFMSQLLVALSLILPRLFDINTPPQSFPSPFDFSFEISPIIFRGNDIVAMLTVPIVIIGLGIFFRYTHVGIAVRASAESADRAALLGVPVKRVETIVWVMSAVLAATAIFMRAGIVGLPIGRVLGPQVLVRALAACVIGRMERLPTIFVAAVGLGIIEQSIVWDTGRGLLVPPIIFAVVMVALLIQRRGVAARADDSSSWQAARAARPMPRELANVPEVKYGKWALGGLLALAAIAFPAFVVESRVNLAAVILIYAMVGISLVVLTGWAGQVSLGQMAFVGLGAAMGGALTTRANWDVSLSLLGAGVFGAALALVIGLPALRIKGLFLAVVTLSFALATSNYLLNNEFFGWWLPQGRIPRNPIFGLISIESETRMYYLCLASLVLVMASVRSVRRSRPGRVLIGIRENERSAQAFGVNATRAKLTAFALSGFIAAFAGSLFVHHQQSLGITPFAPEQSIRVFTMVVIGGLTSVPGALIGAAYIYGIGYFRPELNFFTAGVGGLLVLLMLPSGIGGLLYQARDGILREIAKRRRLVVPSLLADARDADVKTSTDKKFDIAAAINDMQIVAPSEADETVVGTFAPGPGISGNLVEPVDLLGADFAPPTEELPSQRARRMAAAPAKANGARKPAKRAAPAKKRAATKTPAKKATAKKTASTSGAGRRSR